MVGCFAPDCNHISGRERCNPFRQFPNKMRNKTEYDRWVKLVRRQDKEPTENSRLCNCHFPDGRAGGPVLFERNKGKLFAESSCNKPPPPKKRKVELPLCLIVHVPVVYVSEECPQVNEPENLVLDMNPSTSNELLDTSAEESDSQRRKETVIAKER